MSETMSWIPDIAVSEALLRMLVNTAILVAILIVVRMAVARFIRRTVHAAELRRKWLVNARNGFLLLLLLGLVLIWGQELRTLALSIVAIAVAFVIATKELILCVSGSVLKGGSSAFAIGDRIQVRDFRGDVIDHSLLATTILEVGPGRNMHLRTGRMVVLPNSLFVSEPVVNERFTERYGFHAFTVPFRRDDDWQGAQRALLEAAERFCEPYLESVRGHMSRLSDRRGLAMPEVDPSVTIQVPVAGEVHLVVRLPVRFADRSHVEQAIVSEVLASRDWSATAADS